MKKKTASKDVCVEDEFDDTLTAAEIAEMERRRAANRLIARNVTDNEVRKALARAEQARRKHRTTQQQ